MEVLSFQQKPAKTTEEALQKQYQFWNTQPVPKMGERFCYSGLPSFFFFLSPTENETCQKARRKIFIKLHILEISEAIQIK